MAKLSMECKKIMVQNISDRLNEADILIATNYKGLTAQDLNLLRKELRDVSGEYIVVKSSMAKRAITEGPNNRISEFINGETGIAIDKKGDPTCVSKVLVKFAKDRSALEILGGVIKGDLISKDDVKILAALPGREVLLGRLANVLNAPIQGLARALNAIICKFVYALNAVKDKKQEAGKGQVEAKEEVKQSAEPVEGENKPENISHGTNAEAQI